MPTLSGEPAIAEFSRPTQILETCMPSALYGESLRPRAQRADDLRSVEPGRLTRTEIGHGQVTTPRQTRRWQKTQAKATHISASITTTRFTDDDPCARIARALGQGDTARSSAAA